MTNSAASPNASSKTFLLIAIALGILATVLAFVFISTGGHAEGALTDQIVVAKRDISPNTPIDPDRDLMLKPFPRGFQELKRGTLDWESRAGYKGMRVNRDIRAGQLVLVADFSAVGSLELQAPFFALTIPADTGMIIPGDHVKVIVARPSLAGISTTQPTPANDAAIYGPRDGFKVLAVGGYLMKTRAQVTTSDQYNTTTANQRTVTLEVTEPQARELVGALGGLNSGLKATLLICPSELTRPPAPVPAETPATLPQP